MNGSGVKPPIGDGKRKKTSKESFESIPLLTACLTYMGFYFLMLLGFLNQALFKPKVATEKNREVSHTLHAHNTRTQSFISSPKSQFNSFDRFTLMINCSATSND